MWTKRLGLIGIFLTIGIVILCWGNEDLRVSAGSPPRQANAVTASTQIFLPFVSTTYVPKPAPLWRFGAGTVRRALTDYNGNDFRNLRLGWYSNWTVSLNYSEMDYAAKFGVEYAPTVRLKQLKQLPGGAWTEWCITCTYVTPYTYTVSPSRATIQTLAAARPGLTWIIGNEIERVDWGNGGRQDEILPEVYADAYYELYNLIKGIDSTAQIAIGGVIEATPLRLQYLDQVWSTYQTKHGSAMPVDVWNVHAFVLDEESCAQTGVCWGADIPAGNSASSGIVYTPSDNKNFTIAWGHIQTFRSWMKTKGQQGKPLWITEYGVNIPPDWAGFSYAEVRDSFMYPSFFAFLNQTDVNIGYSADTYRLVQRWNWYSFDDDHGYWQQGTYHQYFNGNLFYSGLGGNPMGVSPLGLYWSQYVAPLPPGGGKPYAPAVSAPVPRVDSVPAAAGQSPVTCPGPQRVRVLRYDPSPANAAPMPNRSAPRNTAPREEFFCLPASK